MVLLPSSLEEIVSDRKTILGDILPLFTEGTEEQFAKAAEALARQEDSRYRTMMQELERQCDKYERRVGREFIEPYGLTAKDPTEARRYFIVLKYLQAITEGNERSRSLAAKRIATMETGEYTNAIQALRSANEHPAGNEEVKKLLQKTGGLEFIPVQHQTPQGRRRYSDERDVYDPVAVRRAEAGRQEAFGLLHYGGNRR